MKKYNYISFFLIISFLATSFSSNFKPLFGVRVIVIDAGHGGKDPGCHGSKYNEKDVALAVALKFGKYIEENLKDVKVIYTRKTDVFVELQERAEIANRAKADLFISIHCNSACVRDKKLKRDICRDQVNGAETYVMGIKNENGKLNIAKRENSSILLEDNYVKKYDGFDPNSDESYIIMSMFADTYLNQSLNFASKVQKQYCEKIGRCDKGVKRASLWVLWRTYMPSLLTEIGYLTNPEEEHFLGSAKGQDYIASGLFRAFREYKDEIEGTSKKYEDAFEKQTPYKMSKEDSIEIQNIKNTHKSEVIDTNVAVKKGDLKGIEKNEPVITNDKKKPDIWVKQQDSIKVKDTVNNKKTTKIAAKEDSVKITELTNNIKTFKIPLQKDSMIKAVPLINDKKIEGDSIRPQESQKLAIIYKVQLLSSDKKIPLDSDRLKNVECPGEYVENGIYKYTAGKFVNVKDAMQLKIQLRKQGFTDAFVIAMQDGKRITHK